MPELKPVYLISGDDEAMLDSWRARVRARAEAEGPSATLEVLKGDNATADAMVAAIGSLTLSVGHRYILVDGIKRWSDRDTKQAAAALANVPAETIVVLLVVDKPPAALTKAVEKAGGEVKAYEAPKGAAWPRKVAERASKLGFKLEREAAEALIERVPRDEKTHRLRQRSLMRELEKLATYAGDDPVTVEEVDALTAPAEARVLELADAVIEGDAERALRLAEALRAQGVDLMHILFVLLRQLRNCHRAQAMINAGEPLKNIQSAIGVTPWVAKRVVAQARRADEERLERALELLADLDYDIRGGGQLDPDGALTRMLTRAAGGREPTAV